MESYCMSFNINFEPRNRFYTLLKKIFCYTIQQTGCNEWCRRILTSKSAFRVPEVIIRNKFISIRGSKNKFNPVYACNEATGHCNRSVNFYAQKKNFRSKKAFESLKCRKTIFHPALRTGFLFANHFLFRWSSWKFNSWKFCPLWAMILIVAAEKRLQWKHFASTASAAIYSALSVLAWTILFPRSAEKEFESEG